MSRIWRPKVDWRKRGVSLASLAFLLTLTAACSQNPELEADPTSQAVQEVEAAKAEAEQEEMRQQNESRQREVERQRRARDEPEPVRETLIVVSPGGSSQPSVAELSRATREERARHGDRSVGELTDENLAELSAQGKVTFAAGEGAAGAATDGGEGEATAAGGEAVTDPEAVGEADETCGEACWRRRAHDLRLAWSETVAEITELEEETADLRWRFYAEQDPWVRDSQIKPAWDRALDRLREQREAAERYADRVAELMDEGRRAGALPGWLREGIELEPGQEQERPDRREPGFVEPTEPTMVEEDARQPGDGR